MQGAHRRLRECSRQLHDGLQQSAPKGTGGGAYGQAQARLWKVLARWAVGETLAIVREVFGGEDGRPDAR